MEVLSLAWCCMKGVALRLLGLKGVIPPMVGVAVVGANLLIVQVAAAQVRSDNNSPTSLSAAEGAAAKQMSAKPDLFLSTALTFRSEALLEPRMADRWYQMMPPTKYSKDESFRSLRPIAWSIFFRDTIMKIGALKSKGPTAIYYNPLVDVAVITHWESHSARRYEIRTAYAVPGYALAQRKERSSSSSPLPEWLIAERGPVLLQLVNLAAQRLQDIASVFPIDREANQSQGRAINLNAPDLQEQSEEQVLILLDGLRRAATDRPLRGVIEEVQMALVRGTVDDLSKISIQVDDSASQAVRGTEPEVRKQIELSAVYRSSLDTVLAFYSLPQDGHAYVVATVQGQKEGHRRVVQVLAIDLASGSADKK